MGGRTGAEERDDFAAEVSDGFAGGRTMCLRSSGDGRFFVCSTPFRGVNV